MPPPLQLVRKLLVAVTAATTDPQLKGDARDFGHGVARHMAMLLTAGLVGHPLFAAWAPPPASGGRAGGNTAPSNGGAAPGVRLTINGAAASGRFSPLLYLDALMEARAASPFRSGAWKRLLWPLWRSKTFGAAMLRTGCTHT